ncbi:MAG TPA: hypothetical protein VED20_15665 [Streptosporangiaceae bacterium]|nr:hypothetical protein [Streptosporangiaceae bacterium]
MRRHLSNLPAELTSFVGRREELREVKRLLTTTRLLTLTGTGGVGKTKLALRAAADMSRGFPDGVWLVLLGSIHDPLLMAQSGSGPVAQHGRGLLPRPLDHERGRAAAPGPARASSSRRVGRVERFEHHPRSGARCASGSSRWWSSASRARRSRLIWFCAAVAMTQLVTARRVAVRWRYPCQHVDRHGSWPRSP